MIGAEESASPQPVATSVNNAIASIGTECCDTSTLALYSQRTYLYFEDTITGR
jgi:hypothetical protein